MAQEDLHGQLRNQQKPIGAAGVSRGFFDDVYRDYYTQVVRQLTYLLGDRTAAEDVAQDTFLKLYKAPPPTRQNLGGWLYRVGARLALNYLRGEKRRQQRERQVRVAAGVEVIPLDEALWRQETVRTVREILTELPDRDRIALLLRYTGFTYQEIAGVIGIAPGSVGTILRRAQQNFLKKYQGRKEADT